MNVNKTSIYNNPNCCNNNVCECPICLQTIPLMQLNCNHYICRKDIERIVSQYHPKCPICREPIIYYGCNGNRIHVIKEDEEKQGQEETYTIDYEQEPIFIDHVIDDEVMGGGKRTRTHCKRKGTYGKRTHGKRTHGKRTHGKRTHGKRKRTYGKRNYRWIR